MKKNYCAIMITLLLSVAWTATAQNGKERAKITSRYDKSEMQSFEAKLRRESKVRRAEAEEFAKRNNIPVRKVLDDGTLIELQYVTPQGDPIYYTTHNVDAGISTRTNFLHNNGGLGLNIEGQDMTAYVWDGGLARPSHQEYDGPGGSDRFSIGDNSTTLNFHAAHVTGTIMAYGAQPAAKGMAPQARAIGHDWNNDRAEAINQAANGMLVSNHSYGFRAESIPDYYFGAYITDSRDWDQIMYDAPYYLMVVSAGNDGNQDTYNAAPLGGNSSYDKLNGDKTSKNSMVVANAQDANIGANGELISVSINSSSSEGPTDDLRIKPDITGNGTGVYSSYESSDTAYASITGTSMAAPNVTGSLLLLQQYYKQLNGNFMRSASLKGLALHTADDAGPTGPDPVFGWGLMNTKRAAEVIGDNGTGSQITELTLNNGQTYEITVNSDGINDLLASISWTDLPGTATTATNSNTARLVNDLDIRVIKNGTTFQPWRLTGVTTNGLGDNTRDPYERIRVAGASGSYTIRVMHKGSLTAGAQNYTLILSGISQEQQPCVVAVPTNLNATGTGASDASLSWDALPSASYDVRFRESGTTQWTVLSTLTSNLTITGLSPQTSYEAQVRSKCEDGSQSSYSGSVSFTTTDVQYCTSNGRSTADEFISRVQFNTIDQASGAGNGGYTDFANVSTLISTDTDYTITVTPTWTGTVYSEAYSAWIDWNQDGDFTDAGEQVWTQGPSTNSTVSGTISVPAGAIEGETRMRVSMKYNALPGSCEIFDYGEVEDYTVVVGVSNVDTQAPTVPQDLTANNLTENSVVLSWVSSSDNVGVTGYIVYQDAVELGALTATTTTVTGLTIGTTYAFTVSAMDAAGNESAVSNAVTVTPVDQTAPSTPSNLTASNITQETADLNWNASTDNIGVTGYEVILNGNSLGSVQGTSANLTGLQLDTEYLVSIVAMDEAGNNSTASQQVSFRTLPAITSSGCNATASLPYAESWNSNLGSWAQDSTDDFDWTRQNGGTPSRNTGPGSASDGSHYIYMESSAPNYSSKTARIVSPCIDLGQEAATLTFDYHMYGTSAMGGMQVDLSVDNGATWTQLWSRNGNQGNSWQTAQIDLSSFIGSSVQMRLNGTTGTTWQGDMAVDNLRITTGPQDPCSGVSPWSSSTSYAPGDRVTYNGSLYERTSSGWINLGPCGNTSNYSTDSETQGPPVISAFSIFPNPVTNGILNIKSTLGDGAFYTMFNLQGQVVRKGTLTSQLDVSQLGSGVYLLQVETDAEMISKRFVIK